MRQGGGVERATRDEYACRAGFGGADLGERGWGGRRGGGEVAGEFVGGKGDVDGSATCLFPAFPAREKGFDVVPSVPHVFIGFIRV